VGHGQFCQEGDSHAETSLPLPILPQMDTKNSRKKISLSRPHTKPMEISVFLQGMQRSFRVYSLDFFWLALHGSIECRCRCTHATTWYALPRTPNTTIIASIGEDMIDSDAIEEDNTPKDEVEAVAMHRKGEGEPGHLMLEALPIFAQEDPYMIGLLGRQKYIDIVTTAAVAWVEGVCFLFLLFLVLFSHPLLASGAARFQPENCRIEQIFLHTCLTRLILCCRGMLSTCT
jgi:hypothetical protein